jgi:hypothetical protein
LSANRVFPRPKKAALGGIADPHTPDTWGKAHLAQILMVSPGCLAPQTVFLDVVENPANASDGGGLLWVKL